MKIKKIFLLTLFALVFMSCSSSIDDKSLLIYYSKSKCFGNCETFKLSIFENGLIEYEGIKNVRNIGKYSAQLEENKIIELNKLLKKINFSGLSKSYLNKNIRDLPILSLQVRSRKIKFHKRMAPNKIIVLSSYLDSTISKINLISQRE